MPLSGFDAVHPLSVSVHGLNVGIRRRRGLGDMLLWRRSRHHDTSTQKRQEHHNVLTDISMEFVPGQVIAVMGASGSGKTTFLHAIAGRIRHADVTGQVLFDRQPPEPYFADGSVGFVTQHDHLNPYLSVRETLRYAAELRLPGSIPIRDKYRLVEDVILELGLKECADTLIGDDWRKGISGGEKRRVSVGCSLLLNPSILVLDEPTSGLDSTTAFNLLEMLVGLSRRGRTVFISIHQPRSAIFKLFDSVVLMSGGRTVYAGKGGDKILSYFSEMGLPSSVEANPADHLIDVTTVDMRDEEAQTKSAMAVARLVDHWADLVANGRDHAYACPPRTDINMIRKRSLDMPRLNMVASNGVKDANASAQPTDKPGETADVSIQVGSATTDTHKSSNVSLSLSQQPRFGASFLSQCMILTRRSWKNLLRDNLSLRGSLIEVVVVGLIFGAIFYQLDDTLPGVLTRRSALYITASVQTYLMLIFVIYKLCNDMKVFDRERADHAYGVIPYLFSQFVSQLPFNIIFPLVYAALMYAMMGLRTDDLAIHFTRFACANILAHLVVVAYSQFCVSVARDFATASLVGNSLFTFFSFSTGFFVQLDSIPVYLRWISKISFLTYQYRAMSSNEFSHKTYACKDVGVACLGNNVLASLSIAVDDDTVPYIALVVIVCVFLVLAAVLMQVLTFDLNKHAGAVESSIRVAKVKSVHPAGEDSHGETDTGGRVVDTGAPRVHVHVNDIRLQLETKPWISFQTIQRFVHTTIKPKLLLDNVTVDFPPGELSIIMGGSGTGKTTLLSILTGRKMRLGSTMKMSQTGQVLFNGHPETDPAVIASVCSLVQQSDDHLLSALTCRESLYYAARLRLPHTWSRHQKEDRAEQVLAMLGLRHCADTVVGGDTLKGLSGGEKRRLSIGVQMLTNPSVLVLDEPTSGLDAVTALHVMGTLRQIADSGRTVICSIHQPRSSVYSMFDRIVLLARGGRVAYAGRGRDMISYFASLGHVLPEFTNPADFVLDVSSIDLRSVDAEMRTRAEVDRLVAHWRDCGKVESDKMTQTQRHSEVKERALSTKNGKNALIPSYGDKVDSKESSNAIRKRKMVPFTTAFPVLLSRSIINSRRQPHIVISRVLQVVFLGVIQALYFSRQGHDQVSVQNRLGVIQQTVSVVFIGILNSVASFPAERNLLYYEHADRAYHVEPFFLAYNAIEVPVEVVSSVIYTVFTMVIVGLNTTLGNFLYMTFAVFLLTNMGESIGVAFCSMVDHVGFSVSLTNSVVGVFVNMSGVLSASMPLFLDRINRISAIAYVTRLMVVNEFDASSVFTCTDRDIQMGTCVYRTGADVLRLLTGNPDVFAFEYSQVTMYVCVSVALVVLYRIMAYGVLKWRASS